MQFQIYLIRPKARGHLTGLPELYDLGGLSKVCTTSLNWRELASKTHRFQADKTSRGSVSGVLAASVCRAEKLLLL
jgi:hypothetical protein